MRFRIVVLILLVFYFGEARAQVVTMDGYSLSTENINLIITLSEILAESNISNNDKQEIVNWTIADFKSAPKSSANAHKILNDWAILFDNSQSQFEYDLVRYLLFNSLYFDWGIPAVGGFESFLTTVQRYNPLVYVNNEIKLLITAKDEIILEYEGYPLTSLMQESAVETGEWMARAQFNQADKNSLRQWVLEDFEVTPKISSKNYAYFLNDLLPKIYLQNKAAYELESLREETYRRIYFAFTDTESMASWDNDLMDVVGWYNPVIIEDRVNKLVLTRSAVDEGINMYPFIERIVSSPVPITDKSYAVEKNSLIDSFVNRTDKSSFSSGSWFLIRSRAFWNGLSSNDKRIISQQMKQAYDSTNSISQAIDPLYSNLRIIIQQEQLILTNIYSQTLYLNQQMFNQTLNRHQQIMDGILTDFVDFNTRQSLQISGANILFENNGYYEVEYEPGGIRYQVYK